MTPIIVDSYGPGGAGEAGGLGETPGFDLKLGGLNLGPYLRVSPGEGFDPADPDFATPQFSSSPLHEGGEFVLDNVGLKEKVWPLILNATTKDALHLLIAEINQELDKDAVRVEWRDAGATNSTFFDLVRGRLEPEFNFRRSEHHHANATLRLWVRPYGHTATERIVATAAGSGCLITAALPTRVAGDAPALMDARVTVGSQVPTGGRLVALSVLGHPSYAARYPAASIGDRMAGATLVGASGAAGSQYLGLPVSPTGASGISCKIPLTLPTVYAGQNRVFALARAGIGRGVAVRAFDAEDNELGATTIASHAAGWGFLELGTFSVESGVPTAPKLSLIAGGVSPASGIEGPAVAASPGFHLNEIYVLPEDRTAGVIEDLVQPIAYDGFERGDAAALVESIDAMGHPWATALADASRFFRTFETDGGFVYAFGPPESAAARLPDVAITDARIVAGYRPMNLLTTATRSLALRKEGAEDTWVEGRVQLRPSAFLAVQHKSAGAASAVACAAIAIGSLASNDTLQLTFETVGGRAHAVLARLGGWSASVGGSHVAHAIAGNPGMAGVVDVGRIYDFAVYPVATSTLAPADVYRFDDVNAITWRQQAGGDLTGRLEGKQRGAVPKLAAPSSAQVAVLVAPVADGVANDVCSVDIRCRERFSYAR